MGLDDFFHLDEIQYASRISQCSNIELKKREIEKMRVFLAGSCTFGSSLGAAGFTGGLSLITCAYGTRRMNVAMRKLNIIQAELGRRNIALHTLTARDKIIAAMSGLVSLGGGPTVNVRLSGVQANDAVSTGGDVSIQTGEYRLHDLLHDHG